MNALTSSTDRENRSAPIADQKRPVRILTAFLQKNTIPHALLFTGIDGVGKNRIATLLAMAANCGRQFPPGSGGVPAEPAALQACGDCRSCRTIEKELHPDILQIAPEGRTIRIHQVRTLIETLMLKPMEARRRFVIIQRADTMPDAAANALLKTLEEPPDRTILILLAGQTTDLLPTIVSRCRHIRFHPLRSASIADRLVQAHGYSDADASLAAAAARGSYSRAVALNKSDWKTWRNWLIGASGLERPDTLSRKPTGELLAFAEQLTKSKGRLPEALDTMAGWLRDVIVVRHDESKVTNNDRIGDLRKLSGHLPVAQLMSKLDVIRQAQSNLESSRNFNVRLTLEAMVLRLAKDYVKESRLD